MTSGAATVSVRKQPSRHKTLTWCTWRLRGMTPHDAALRATQTCIARVGKLESPVLSLLILAVPLPFLPPRPTAKPCSYHPDANKLELSQLLLLSCPSSQATAVTAVVHHTRSRKKIWDKALHCRPIPDRPRLCAKCGAMPAQPGHAHPGPLPTHTELHTHAVPAIGQGCMQEQPALNSGG